MKLHGAPQAPSDNIESVGEPLIRVLCVDDETGFLNSTKQILELKGVFHVETASSVKDALQRMGDRAFDVIVSDYQMPEKDGLDFLKELREGGNDVPFILFTGKGREEVAVKALNLGADRYFNKFGHPETVYGELVHGIRQTVAQRRAEQEIWDREERLRAILASSPDAMIVADLHRNITDCNLESLKLLEFSSKKEIIGNNYYIFIKREDQEQVTAAVNELLEHDVIHNLECRLLTKSGREIPVELSASILRDAYGKPVGIVGLARNITERKKADEALRKSEEKYRNIVELSPDGITIANLKGVITSVNRAFLELTGFSENEIVGKHFTKLGTLRMKDIPKYVKMIGPIFRGKKLGPIEFVYLRKDGTQRLAEARIRLLKEKSKTVGLQAILRDITERKRIENVLKESEEKYRSVVEHAPDALITLDVNGTVTSCNPAGLAITGYSEDELVGKNFTELSPVRKEDLPKFMKLFKTLLDKKVLDPFEVTYITKGGKYNYGEVHVSVIKKEKTVTGFQVVMRDITEHKKAEEELRESEKRFRELSELLPEVIFETDNEGVLQFVNHAAYIRFGYSREEFETGLNALQMIAPEDKDRARKNIGRVLCGETIGSNEYTALKKDGGTFPILINSTPIIRDNKILGMRGLMVEITDHKKTEDTLRESEEKFRNLAEQSPNMIFINQEGKVVYVNPKCEELMGYTKEEFYDPHFSFLNLISPEYIEMIQSSFSKHQKGEEVPPYEYSIITKTGKRIETIITTKLIQYQGKSAILGTITDITERKKTEDTLKETLTKMGALNEKLGVIGKLTMHDARNKLSTIANNAYLAKQLLGKGHAALANLADIELAVDRIEKILEFSRIYEMLGTEELSDVNVKKSFEEAVMLLSCFDNVEFVNECDGLTVRADSLLRQIFYNLIDNSLKHGEKVSRIKVYCKEGKDWLKLVYEDNGMGIAESERNKIFREGYGKGTGYGLYLIKKICEAYGWSIHETGTPRNGAQFVMTIPKLDKNGESSYIIKED